MDRVEGMSGNHDLGRFEGEVLARLDYIQKTLEHVGESLCEHEGRLRQTENNIASIKTLGSLGVILVGAISAFISRMWR